MKIVTIVGARPQFIKAATVSRALVERGVNEVLVHTGQHYDANMSEIFFEELQIPRPLHHLGVGGGPHGQMTGRQLEKIEEVLLAERPDWVLVYGDTNSTLAGALAAVKLHLPVAHVEAGLRSFNRRMPEEINRVLTDHASDVLFAPTEASVRNLANEGVTGDKVRLVGDVMYDAARFYARLARKPSWFDRLGVPAGTFVLCTVHRAENTDDDFSLRKILNGLEMSGLPVVLPLHPRTRKKVDQLKISLGSNIHVVDPVGYLEMTWLEINCSIVATDSGGVQKEAYFHGKRCITLRNETEWVELVEAGVNELVGCDSSAIALQLNEPHDLNFEGSLFGDGNSARHVARMLCKA